MKKKITLNIFIKIFIGIGEMPFEDIFWFIIIMLVAPREATIARVTPNKFITLNDGPKTMIIPIKVIRKRIFTLNKIFSLSTIIE